MSTLYKRATKNQMKLLKAVSGAVLNEADAHGKSRDYRQSRSIAKRAVGTISALWPDVLVAARPPPSGGIADGLCSAVPQSGYNMGCPDCARRTQLRKRDAKRGVLPSHEAPLRCLIKQLSGSLWEMKKSDPYRAEVHIDVLRKTSKILKGL